MKEKIKENCTQLVEKIADTNLRINTFQTKVQREPHDQAVRIETKNKDLRTECKKKLNETCKQVEDHMDEKIDAFKAKEDNKKVIEETSTAAITSIKYKIKVSSTDINQNLKLEVDKLKREVRGSPTHEGDGMSTTVES